MDLKPKLEEKAREWLKDTGLEIRVMSHHCDYRKSTVSMDERFDMCENILTQYQNSKMVITRRLHVTLPCLAMETPVMSIVNMDDEGNRTRWAPYESWVRYVSEKDFLSKNFEYDFKNPLPNHREYMETRESLIKAVGDFVHKTKDITGSVFEIKKTKFSEEEAREWQNNLMHWTLDTWLHKNRGLLAERNKLKVENKKLKKMNATKNLSIEDIEKLLQQSKEIAIMQHRLDHITFKDVLKSYYKRVKNRK